jgi:excisionase family DNA binding protein
MAQRAQASLPFPDSHKRPWPARRRSATLTIPEVAKLLGISRNLAYEIATRDGELAGIQVLRVGRRLLIPQAHLLEVLGLEDGSDPISR